MRVVVAGLFHETNTFLEGIAMLEDFTEVSGPALLRLAGDASPMAGLLEEAARRSWELIPAADLRATPGPTVSDAVINRFWNHLECVLANTSYDAVLLVLHGAMVSESQEDVEGWILSKVRERIGPSLPLGAVLDLHANMTIAMAESANLLLAYRENPHTDAKRTGERAVALMDRILHERLTAQCVLRSMPIIWPPTGTGTTDEPMASLESTAREIEATDPQVLAMNILAGFAFSDLPTAGLSFCCVTTATLDAATAHINRLAHIADNAKHLGLRQEQDLEKVISQLAEKQGGPYLLIEAADNIGAGSSGRSLGVLEALLRHGIENAAVAIQAPELVADLARSSLGDVVNFTLKDPFSKQSLALVAKLLSRSDGCFELEDPHSHLASMVGASIDMGSCAVVQSNGVRILLTSKRTPPFDLGQFRSQGIEPEKLFVVGIKAAVAHRRAWDPIAVGSFWVDVAGPCSSNLQRLPYRRLRRPIYPLDAR